MSVDVLPTKTVDTQTVQQWHTLNVSQTFEKLGCSARGLTVAEAERRLTEYGPNQLQAPPASPWMSWVGSKDNPHPLICDALSRFLGECW